MEKAGVVLKIKLDNPAKRQNGIAIAVLVNIRPKGISPIIIINTIYNPSQEKFEDSAFCVIKQH